MPTYDYQCRSCGLIREVVHSMLEDGPAECEHCGGQLRRVVHPTGIIFKGSGFYKTDSRSSSSGSVTGASQPAASSSTGATDTAPPPSSSPSGDAGSSSSSAGSGSAGDKSSGSGSSPPSGADKPRG